MEKKLLEEKKKKLEEIFSTLKSEFVGLDSILDEIKTSITPWYLTPEIINRPVVVSLWGMTGTGKTSVISRLVELLNYKDKTLFFDCGLESDDTGSGGGNISDTVANKLGLEDYDGKAENLYEDIIFVFDEFQYSRTLDESGCELTKSPLRPIWEIMDNGKISINSFTYEVNKIINFVEDFNSFIRREKLDPELVDGKFKNIEDYNRVVNSLELKRHYRGGPYLDTVDDYEDEEEESAETISKKNKRLDLFEDIYYLNAFIKKLNNNSTEDRLGYRVFDDINKSTKVSEVLNILNTYKKVAMEPRILYCKKSLVFILGNLDEAFGVEKDLNPDYDADVFKDITSKVSITDIKDALKKRFRAEQIARFGNNIIKYPTLNREEFTKIIVKEMNRVSEEFKKSSNIELKYGDDIIKLLYFEGVYPVQGVRPLFTTIGNLITPILSDIVLNKESDDDNEVLLSLKNIEDLTKNLLKIPETTLEIKYISSGKSFDKKIKLQLGELRNPKNKKTRYITSVHESGHAIVAMYLNKKYPTTIVSVSTNNGGFCDTFVKEDVDKIDSKEDIDNEVMISLGGYLAEKLVYEDHPEKCLMGSGSDLLGAWNILSDSIYNTGYLIPMLFSNYKVEFKGGGIPNGFDINSIEYFNKDTIKIDYIIQRIWDSLIEKTNTILKNEVKLLKEMSLYLGENGSIPIDKLKELVEKYGKELTPEYMKNSKSDEDYYYSKLID